MGKIANISIFQTLKSIFTMKGASDVRRRPYFEFLLVMILVMIHTVTTKKVSFVWAPLQAFLDICHFFGHFHFVSTGWKKIPRNLGHNLHKKCKIVSFESSLSEKQPSTF